MKTNIIGLLALFVFATTSYGQNNYTISGTITSPDANGRKVYLQQFDENYKKRIDIDSTTVVDSHFTFTGIAPAQPAFAIVITAQPNKDERPLQSFIVLEKGNISLLMDDTNPSLKGTVGNDDFSTFMATLDKLEKSSSEEDNTVLYKKTYYDYVKKNSGTPVGDFVLMSSSYLYQTPQLRELLSEVSDQFKQTSTYTSLNDRCTKLEATAVGKQYIDVKGKTPEGEDVALSSYVGKSSYVLIDFWASWCGPCRKEMPSIVDAYAKYKTKGLEIVGISLDNKNESWVEAIKQLNITWPQMSDMKGWKSELSDPYGVSSIPNTVIVDKDGKIVARGLYGEELLKKLEELLK